MVKVKVKSREIYISGKIMTNSALQFSRALKKIDKKPYDSISVLINSDGGDAKASVAIHHAMRNAGSFVQTIGYGRVASGGLVILQGGDKRFATPSCRIKFHQACAELSKGRAYNAEILNMAVRKLLRADAVDIYILTAMGSPIDTIVELFDRDAVINSKIAHKIKIIDGIWKKQIKKPR